MTGLTMPPNWPKVLITAIPPAAPAPAPASSLGGRVQKLGMEAMIPAPSRPSATIRNVVWLAKIPAQKKPMAPTATSPATNLRRSPEASDKRPITTMLIAPQMYGMAVSRPIITGLSVPALRISCGAQKFKP
ncbi:hypothetical protein D3C71_1763360 [compost metagenome]